VPDVPSSTDDRPDPAQLARRLSDAALVVGRAAHDFDNVLQGVIGFADLTLGLLPPGTPAHAYVTELLKVGQRGLTLTQQMHQFSRGGTSRPQPGRPGLVLEVEAGRLRGGLPPGVSLVTDAPPDLPAVALDTEPLRQVVGHLLDNACEAASAGGPGGQSPPAGVVTATARRITLDSVTAAEYLGAVAPGEHVLLTVTDTGPGIAPEVRRRLFVEPFYTTKPRHRGLGLAVVYRILHTHRAGLVLAPNAPKGTLARVALPVSP
jgi:signal transduction histidine kinase